MPKDHDDRLHHTNALARQLEQQLRVEDLGRMVEHRRRSRSKTSIVAIFIGGAALVLTISLAVFLSKQKLGLEDRLTQLEAKSAQRIQAARDTPGRPDTSPDTPTNRELAGRLAALETLQEAWVSASKSALEQMNFVFAVVAAFFGVFSLFLAYRQVVADSEQGAHEDEVRSLIGSFRQNMAVINDLIITLEKNYSYREEVQKQLDQVNVQLTTVKQYKESVERTFDDRVVALNAEAYALFVVPIDRHNFKSAGLRGRLESHGEAMNTLDRTGSVEGKLSPFCYFLRSLNAFNDARYSYALSDLETARVLALRELGEPTPSWYRDVAIDEVKSALKRLMSDVVYHVGIINYNSGGFDKARSAFAAAVRTDPLDFRSRIYVPEIMFFQLAPFDEVAREFAAVERELMAVPLQERPRMSIRWEEAMASLKMREGNLYLPKYPSLAERSQYSIRESAQRAAQSYEVAVQNSEVLDAQDLGKTSLPRVFARFSLAQALEQMHPAEQKGRDPSALYQRSLDEFMNETVVKTEPVVLVQLNYAMAACASRLDSPPQSPAALLAKAREQLQRVPEAVRIFSPLYKVLRTREELISEMRDFEERSRHVSAAKA